MTDRTCSDPNCPHQGQGCPGNVIDQISRLPVEHQRTGIEIAAHASQQMYLTYGLQLALLSPALWALVKPLIPAFEVEAFKEFVQTNLDIRNGSPADFTKES